MSFAAISSKKIVHPRDASLPSLNTQITQSQKQGQLLNQKKQNQEPHGAILHNSQQPLEKRNDFSAKKNSTVTKDGPSKLLNLGRRRGTRKLEPQMALPSTDNLITIGLEYKKYLKFEDDVTQYFENE